MIIKTLSLKNFRNYEKRLFEFSPKTTLIVGPNTTGKTNILEAVYLLATGKSMRATYDKELVRFDAALSHISCLLSHEDTQVNLEIVIISSENYENLSRKRFKVNGISRQMNKFVGNLSAVMFSPEDIELVTDSPSLRRKYLDSVLVQVDQGYRRAISGYIKVLRRRNKLLEKMREGLYSPLRHSEFISESGRPGSEKMLKPASPNASQGGRVQDDDVGLEFWDGKLLEAGTLIQKSREKFFGFLEEKLPEISKLLMSGGQLLKVKYIPNVISKDRLEEYRDRGVAAAKTLVGPHRDEFRFYLTACRHPERPRATLSLPRGSRGGVEGSSQEDSSPLAFGDPWGRSYTRGAQNDEGGRDLSSFGSRGEQRTAVLALKLAELDFVKEKIGGPPILLLDDIFSELDEEHQRRVLGLLGKQQTILTTTDAGLVGEKLGEMEAIRLS